MMLRLATLLAVMTTPAYAETPIWSVEEAQRAVQADEVLLLDIRSREEWKETGLAEGALPVSMHESDFGAKLQTLMKIGKPIALICATGGRTNYIVGLLEKNGFTGVVDVSEGMIGNRRGKGWIAKNLPIVDLAAGEKALSAITDE